MAGSFTTAEIDSPIGPLLLGAVGRSLCLLEFATEARAERQLKRIEHRLGVASARGTCEAIDQTEAELAAYFEGKLTEFTIPLELHGTPFQKRVWHELQQIPAGKTVSYATIAQSLDDPAATRAVGTANGANPISIVVPCHRVVRTGGALGGYGGGLDRKRWLLEHEHRVSGASLFA